MNYIHHPYAYQGHPTIPMDHQQHMAFDPAMAHPSSIVHPIDGGYLYPHPPPPFDMMDFYHQPIMDYEEYAENLSRPRLTKDQVETLEAQFQAHPKPSSNVKRQLAAQTNLSLPRVANWFQNRRAKAKQQRRQEEFERMQKAKVEAEEAARSKSGDQSDSKEDVKTEADKILTPKQEESHGIASYGERTKTSTAPPSSRSKHQKSRSESAREATFASLQRALDAAAAGRLPQHGDDGDSQPNTNDIEESVSPTPTTTTSAFPASSNSSNSSSSHGGNAQSAFSTPLVEAWPSRNSQEPYGSHHRESYHRDAYQSVPYPTQREEWMGPLSASSSSEPLPHHRTSQDAGSYGAMQYPLQSEASLSRRASSDELATHLEGIDKSSWKETGKELDLAARRKRPRPAAIGTSKSSSMLSASASMSPNTRMQGYSSGHGIRQSKSAQSLNSRYAGVRKASAAQRSPLNFSTFSEAGGLNASKADMASMLQPTVTTNTLAPPTPLTPEDMQHLLPTSPSDGYCLSAQPSGQFFPTTQPMQINVASPPATPMTAVDMMSSYPYQTTAPPPMSAPAHYTSFPEYTPCDAAPLTARSWGDNTPSIPSPDPSYHPGACHMQQPSDISPISYDPSAEPSGQVGEHGRTPEMSPSMGTMAADGKFMIQEFPDQQQAHRFVAQQLPSQTPKNYTFTNNQTPNDF